MQFGLGAAAVPDGYDSAYNAEGGSSSNASGSRVLDDSSASASGKERQPPSIYEATESRLRAERERRERDDEARRA